ncbi:tetratricopeptide repeat protein [Elizabethkingia sp. JS20170427COW]|uniref:tetratricopeptide repeat protein n=1 Tax=Elizabethkingia sp. JS20170427COW TaxID=2583851 RepID=UPI001110E738|nr:tetratricopeptide repeat protein [Elizabethkingia sp. JS20170427COW]QCX53283.1 tetratricopeptide repeat protein [Elizabethkingia sp. JS20170427COW]
MSKNKSQGKETVEFFEDLDKRNLDSEKFIEKYAKAIGGVLVIVLLGILGYFGYDQLVVKPKNEEALVSFLAAQKNLSTGKEDLALGGKSSANPGFLGTYQDFSGTPVGKLSAYNAAILEFKNGKYQKAYDLMDNFGSSNKILVALKYGLMADAQANLKKGDDAIALFDKAISASDDDFTTYYFTRKAGLLAIALKKNDLAKKYFTTIDEKYQDYDGGASDAYIEMVKYY